MSVVIEKSEFQTFIKFRLIVHKNPADGDGLFDDDHVVALNQNSMMSDVFDYVCTFGKVDTNDYGVCPAYKYSPNWTLEKWTQENDEMKSCLYNMLCFEIRPI